MAASRWPLASPKRPTLKSASPRARRRATFVGASRHADLELSESLGTPTERLERLGQQDVALGVGLVPTDGRAEPVDRLGIVLLIERGKTQVVGRDLGSRIRRIPVGDQELLLALVPLARENESRAQIVANVDVVGIELERLAVLSDGLGVLALAGEGVTEGLAEVGVLVVRLDGLVELLDGEIDPALAKVGESDLEVRSPRRSP